MARQNGIGKLNEFFQAHCATYKLLKLIIYRNSSRYFQYDLAFYKTEDARFIDAMSILLACDSVCKTSGVKLDVAATSSLSCDVLHALFGRSARPYRAPISQCRRGSRRPAGRRRFLPRRSRLPPSRCRTTARCRRGFIRCACGAGAGDGLAGRRRRKRRDCSQRD